MPIVPLNMVNLSPRTPAGPLFTAGQWLRAWACLLVLCPMIGFGQPGNSALKVGEFSLVVGEVIRVDAAGNRQQLRTGDTLQEQDRLITGSDALAMIVFVDKARLAVRPDTELVVRRYRIDASGAQTRLEFDLLRGTVRQISGEAARQQPDRYRLNTPIAVIGVRGTDFLARATDRKLETYIHEGMIVLMPARADCPSSGCPVLASSSAADAGRMLQMSATGAIERLSVLPEDVERIFGIRVLPSSKDASQLRPGVPVTALASVPSSGSLAFAPLIFSDPNAQALQGAPGVGSGTSGGSAPGGAGSAGDGGGLGGPGSAAGGGSGASQVGGASGSSASAATGTTGATTGATVTPPATSVVGTDSTPPVTTPVAMPTTLVWGRFTDALQIPLTLTESYDSARQGRHVTVGELGQYALWRNNPGGTINPALSGRATFGLAMGQAFYRTEASTASALIESARLSADFDRSTFSTELKMSTSGGVTTLLSATGRINDEGLFLSLAPDGSQRVAGAFSRNGQEAGYLFNKVVGSGVFQGVTLWGIRK